MAGSVRFLDDLGWNLQVLKSAASANYPGTRITRRGRDGGLVPFRALPRWAPLATAAPFLLYLKRLV